jgi:hypothetical protein
VQGRRDLDRIAAQLKSAKAAAPVIAWSVLVFIPWNKETTRIYMSNKMFYCMLEKLRSFFDQSNNSAMGVSSFLSVSLEIKNLAYMERLDENRCLWRVKRCRVGVDLRYFMLHLYVAFVD